MCLPITAKSSSVSFDIVLDRGLGVAEKAATTLLSLLGIGAYGSGSSVQTNTVVVKREDAPLIMSAVHRATRKHLARGPPPHTIKEFPVKA